MLLWTQLHTEFYSQQTTFGSFRVSKQYDVAKYHDKWTETEYWTCCHIDKKGFIEATYHESTEAAAKKRANSMFLAMDQISNNAINELRDMRSKTKG